jgi:hypothetical protein
LESGPETCCCVYKTHQDRLPLNHLSASASHPTVPRVQRFVPVVPQLVPQEPLSQKNSNHHTLTPPTTNKAAPLGNALKKFVTPTPVGGAPSAAFTCIDTDPQISVAYGFASVTLDRVAWPGQSTSALPATSTLPQSEGEVSPALYTAQ